MRSLLSATWLRNSTCHYSFLWRLITLSVGNITNMHNIKPLSTPFDRNHPQDGYQLVFRCCWWPCSCQQRRMAYLDITRASISRQFSLLNYGESLGIEASLVIWVRTDHNPNRQ
ncbi:hypothetical protein V6N11_052755 [Hibiscus sabdariffa]|uniref:Uncharacterized protein n=1 Tax=Hibiscus sabdariffa TaxID=183260 RepID=A0ABR2UBN7_9ROSI